MLVARPKASRGSQQAWTAQCGSPRMQQTRSDASPPQEILANSLFPLQTAILSSLPPGPMARYGSRRPSAKSAELPRQAAFLNLTFRQSPAIRTVSPQVPDDALWFCEEYAQVDKIGRLTTAGTISEFN